MADRITIDGLADAIQQNLEAYSAEVTRGLDKASEAAVKDLVKLTKATAPVGRRGSYKKNIAGKLLRRGLTGSTYVWYVKPPDYRLTHLLVHGHATKDGGRTPANPFLARAIDRVQQDYEREVEEVVRNGG